MLCASCCSVFPPLSFRGASASGSGRDVAPSLGACVRARQRSEGWVARTVAHSNRKRRGRLGRLSQSGGQRGTTATHRGPKDFVGYLSACSFLSGNHPNWKRPRMQGADVWPCAVWACPSSRPGAPSGWGRGAALPAWVCGSFESRTPRRFRIRQPLLHVCRRHHCAYVRLRLCFTSLRCGALVFRFSEELPLAGGMLLHANPSASPFDFPCRVLAKRRKQRSTTEGKTNPWCWMAFICLSVSPTENPLCRHHVAPRRGTARARPRDEPLAAYSTEADIARCRGV
jgi:hypothetical protein